MKSIFILGGGGGGAWMFVQMSVQIHKTHFLVGPPIYCALYLETYFILLVWVQHARIQTALLYGQHLLVRSLSS